MMLSRDGIAGLVCLAISLVMLVLTLGLPPAIEIPIGPAFYPRVVLWFMAGLSALLVALDLMARRGRPAAAAAEVAVAARPNYGLVLATFVEFGLYIAILPELGFRIATVVFVVALQVTLEWPRSLKAWALVGAVAVATSLVCHFVFEDYLSVLLPRGSWSGL
jgi:putative tricarboxylic transport membrane protein